MLHFKKGVVADFYRMNRIIAVDPETHSVTVQAGVVWEKLDREQVEKIRKEERGKKK